MLWVHFNRTVSNPFVVTKNHNLRLQKCAAIETHCVPQAAAPTLRFDVVISDLPDSFEIFVLTLAAPIIKSAD